jgi:2-polyprenyl-3-methyl-5-hydroxy-6-metoxy-1,4-benzoquinol methylase
MSPLSSNGNHLGSYLPFPLEMEKCACAICSSSNARTLLTFDSFGFPTRTVECQKCGLVYVSPRPTRQYMEKFYTKWFRFFYEGRRKISEEYIRDKKWLEWDASRMKRYSGYLAGQRRVLDIGCGAGYFAAQVQTENVGTTVVGIEPDPMMASHCREKLKLHVYAGFFETFPSSDVFDVITAFHVIEHVFDLPEFLAFLRLQLRDGGVAIIETPNVTGSWNGIGMFHLAHLYTFSPRTITSLFLTHGFEILKSEPLENDFDHSNLCLIARKAEKPAQTSLLPVDERESEQIVAKCREIRSFRAERVVRNWAKVTYFGLRDHILRG